jgi:inner membrane protein
MDTFSHILIGLGLGALAQIDPIIADNSTLSQAVIIGTVAGSNAPDFDYLYNLKGKGSYYRNHRGWSHSLPALPLWGLAVTSAIYPFFLGTSFLHLFFWTFLAVILHVVFDLLNVHGTQALRPFSPKRLSFDFIPLVDPYIIMLHILGFSLLPFYMAGNIFLFIYSLLAIYLLIRIISALLAKRNLHLHFHKAIHIKLIPHTTILHWNVIIETNEDFLFGVYTNGDLLIEHTLPKKIIYPALVLESRTDEQVADFLEGTQYAYPFVQKRKNGYFVYWKDLRFRKNHFFPKLAIIYISSDLKSKISYTGKLTSIKHYKKVVKNLEATIK